MRVCPLSPAPHLMPSDAEQTRTTPVGMGGLRHKLRHKISSPRLSSPIVQGHPRVGAHVHAPGRVQEKILAGAGLPLLPNFDVAPERDSVHDQAAKIGVSGPPTGVITSAHRGGPGQLLSFGMAVAPNQNSKVNRNLLVEPVASEF